MAFKNYCDAFKNEKVADLFHLQEEDMHYLKNDNLEQENEEDNVPQDELTFEHGHDPDKFEKFKGRVERKAKE